MDEHKRDEDENIEKKMYNYPIFNSILAKTRNLILWKQKQFGFLVRNQSESAIQFSYKTTWFRRIYFSKKHHISDSCTDMSDMACLLCNEVEIFNTALSFASCSIENFSFIIQ